MINIRIESRVGGRTPGAAANGPIWHVVLGFIVSVVITVMGYFLYTLLSPHSRIQFGILRTIGLSLWQLIAMLSGTVVIGGLRGALGSIGQLI